MPDPNREQSHTVSDQFQQHQQKKAIKEAKALRVRRIKTFKKIGYWVAGLLIVIGAGWLLIKAIGPKGLDYSQAVTVLERNHIDEGTNYTSYNSNPPTSGPHYPNPAPARFYDTELPDEQVVHNLEHGHIWISYKPDIPKEIIKSLENQAGSYVIVTERSKNNTDIMLAAWGRLDKFNVESGKIDIQRIKDFILRYRNKGPENPSGFSGHLR